jgi:hypothetical protein
MLIAAPDDLAPVLSRAVDGASIVEDDTFEE